MIGGFLRRRVGGPVLTLLRQGTAPEKMAICLALGAGVGVFPVLGTTTILCTVLAIVLRLNLVAIQVANYLVYPLQILLIIPFVRLGEWLVGAPAFPLSVAEIVELFNRGFGDAVGAIATALGHAVIGWAVVVPALTVVLWLGLLPVLRRTAAALATQRAPEAG